MRSRAKLICHAVAWVLLGCAFLIISVPHVWVAFRAYSFPRIDRYHTTDSYMASLLHVQSGSERLTRAFSALPPDQPVAVLLREGDDEGVFVGYLVTYFAWPREVHSVAVTRANAATQMRALERESLGAVFFCGIDPPPRMKPVISIGSQLSIVPRAASPAAAPE